jgi:hypothetical protein
MVGGLERLIDTACCMYMNDMDFRNMKQKGAWNTARLAGRCGQRMAVLSTNRASNVSASVCPTLRVFIFIQLLTVHLLHEGQNIGHECYSCPNDLEI